MEFLSKIKHAYAEKNWANFITLMKKVLKLVENKRNSPAKPVAGVFVIRTLFFSKLHFLTLFYYL